MPSTSLRIALATIAALALLFLALEFSAVRSVKRHLIASYASRLLTDASLVAECLSRSAPAKMDEELARLGRVAGARITLIASDGAVLADSDLDASSLPNNAERPEIREAALSGTGSDVRTDAASGSRALFVARRAALPGGEDGFVRLTGRLAGVDRSLAAFRVLMLTVLLVVFFAATGVAAYARDRFRRIADRISAFSQELAGGNLDHTLVLGGAGDLGRMERNLNRMAEGLRAIIQGQQAEFERLTAILRSIPDALLIMDPEGSIVLASHAARAFFGQSNISGRAVRSVVRSAEYYTLLDDARPSAESITRVVVLPHPRERFVSVTVSPLFTKNAVLSGYISLFHDITEIKKLEKVRRDFVANVSHELKTPIAAIKGFAETLLDGAIDDRENARRFLGIISAQSARINTLVEDLLVLSRIELGVTKTEKAPVALGEVLAHVFATLDERARLKGLALSAAPKCEGFVLDADRDQLIQILTNLLDNAIKYTERGGVSVSLAAGETGTALVVRDTGIGIPARDLPRIGERFYRPDPSRSREMGGTGLGLAIVKHLVRAHGWTMAIESIEGAGTTVSVGLGGAPTGENGA
jgi:two-component system phosphate regulon sensor histidine kinase PhoR